MKYNTAVRRSILSSLKLKKVIVCDSINSEVIINGEVTNRKKAIYRATVEDNEEYKAISVCGYSEADVFKKLNDGIIEYFKANHHSEYENICKTTRMTVEV